MRKMTKRDVARPLDRESIVLSATIAVAIAVMMFGMTATTVHGATPKLTDVAISDAVEDELAMDQAVASYLIDVTTVDGIVTLRGSVDSWSEFDAAAANAYEGGAVFVDNDLIVK